MTEGKPLDLYEERERIIKEGKQRWAELTKDWSPEDRQWAEKFWANAGMPWA